MQALRSAYLSLGLGPASRHLLRLSGVAGRQLPESFQVRAMPPTGTDRISAPRGLVLRHALCRSRRSSAGPATVIAVNVGGALIPGLLSLCPVRPEPIMDQRILATVVVATAACRWFAQPGAWPRHCASRCSSRRFRQRPCALCCRAAHAAALAYISGSLGTLIGARSSQSPGEVPRAAGAESPSIGGAGTSRRDRSYRHPRRAARKHLCAVGAPRRSRPAFRSAGTL